MNESYFCIFAILGWDGRSFLVGYSFPIDTLDPSHERFTNDALSPVGVS